MRFVSLLSRFRFGGFRSLISLLLRLLLGLLLRFGCGICFFRGALLGFLSPLARLPLYFFGCKSSCGKASSACASISDGTFELEDIKGRLSGGCSAIANGEEKRIAVEAKKRAVRFIFIPVSRSFLLKHVKCS